MPIQTPDNQAAPADVTSYCAVPPRGTLPVTKVIKGRGPSGGREVTELSTGGLYRVSRCDDNGALQVSRVIGPIAVPGGGTALVPLAEIDPLPDGTMRQISATYGTPANPQWAARWNEVGPRITARAFPVTPPEREVK